MLYYLFMLGWKLVDSVLAKGISEVLMLLPDTYQAQTFDRIRQTTYCLLSDDDVHNKMRVKMTFSKWIWSSPVAHLLIVYLLYHSVN